MFYIHLQLLLRFQFLDYLFQIHHSSALKNLKIGPQNVSHKTKKNKIKLKSLVSLESIDLVHLENQHSQEEKAVQRITDSKSVISVWVGREIKDKCCCTDSTTTLPHVFNIWHGCTKLQMRSVLDGAFLKSQE